MNNEFVNEKAQQAVDQFRNEQNPQNLLQIATAILSSPLLLPVQSEGEPEKNEQGQYVLKPGQSVNLLAVKSNKGDLFFPFFTSTDEARKVYDNPQVYLLPLTFQQYMPMIEANKEKAKGLVINPSGANVPMRYEMLKGMADAMNRPRKPGLNRNSLKKGQKIHLRNPQENVDDLEAALISGGFHEKDINRIFLKERILDPEHPENSHWFVVVDSSDNDPEVFKRLAELCKDALHGKEMEFMFANQKLGQDIASSSRPIYEKAAFTI